MERFYTLFYSHTLKRDRFLHILRLQHFEDLVKEIDIDDKNSDRLWKIIEIIEVLRTAYEKNYSPLEPMDTDEVILLFKGKVIFTQCPPPPPKKKTQHFQHQNL
jgi:hypothetical protein